MRRALLALAAIGLAACAPAQVQPLPAFPLVNPGFEEPPPAGECPRGWGCSAHSDPASFRFFLGPGSPGGGAHSLCAEPVKHEPWTLITQGRFDAGLRGKRLRYVVDIKLDDVTGRGAGAVATSHDGHGRTIRTQEHLLTGTHDWQTVSVEMLVPQEAVEADVGATLDGRGRICFDNARVEVLP